MAQGARPRVDEAKINSSEDLLVKNLGKVFRGSRVLRKFFESDKFMKILVGPVGSAKTYTCALAVGHCGASLPYHTDGVMYSKHAVVRGTYAEMDSATFNIWQDVYPEETFGAFGISKTPRKHRIFRSPVEEVDEGGEFVYYDLPLDNPVPQKGGRFIPGIDMVVDFWAIERESDIRRVLSTRYTTLWFNEGDGFKKRVIDRFITRLGRYPGVELTQGKRFQPHVFVDTNPPKETHWIARARANSALTGAKAKKGFEWGIFEQPPAVILAGDYSGPDSFEAHGKLWRVNPRAENLSRVGKDYYIRQGTTLSDAEFDTYLRNLYAEIIHGEKVFPEYHREETEIDLEPDRALPVRIGVDFGKDSAIVLGQRDDVGRWFIFDEFIGANTNSKTFAEEFVEVMKARYPYVKEWIGWGDPAGKQGENVAGHSHFDFFTAAGINLRPTPSNDFSVRRDSASLPMVKMVDGKPALRVGHKCPKLRAALRGGFHYIEGADGLKPNKRSVHSHVADAYMYLVLGVGEGFIDHINNPLSPLENNAIPEMIDQSDYRDLV